MVDRNGAASTIEQKLVYVGRENGKLIAMRQLLVEGMRPPILVFVQSKDRASELLEELRGRGWKVGSTLTTQICPRHNSDKELRLKKSIVRAAGGCDPRGAAAGGT